MDKPIDIDTTKLKNAPFFKDLVSGDALLRADPGVAGRYRVEDLSESCRVLGYLVTEAARGGGVSIARLSTGLDELLAIRTVNC